MIFGEVVKTSQNSFGRPARLSWNVSVFEVAHESFMFYHPFFRLPNFTIFSWNLITFHIIPMNLKSLQKRQIALFVVLCALLACPVGQVQFEGCSSSQNV